MNRLVVIGGSAGGFDSLMQILRSLPESYPWPIVIVMHVPPKKESVLHEAFSAHCSLPTKEAEDKEPLRGGMVYFAPANYHLLVEPEGLLSLSVDEPVHFSRPSIDVLFESAAVAAGPALVAVLLSGSSADGAAGIARVVAEGGTALVQDPTEAPYPTMPAKALAMAPASQALSLAEISRRLGSLESRAESCRR